MADGTPEGRKRKRKADATRGKRERAWAQAFLGLSRKWGRVPTGIEVADHLYKRDPDLLPPNVRRGAAARQGKA